MNPFDALRICLFTKLLNFTDRASRSEYWWFFLVNFVVQAFLDYYLALDYFEMEFPYWYIYTSIVLWLTVAWLSVGIRRMRDINTSPAIAVVCVSASFCAIHVSYIVLALDHFVSSEITIELSLYTLVLCHMLFFFFMIRAASSSAPFSNQCDPTPTANNPNTTASPTPYQSTPPQHSDFNQAQYNQTQYEQAPASALDNSYSNPSTAQPLYSAVNYGFAHAADTENSQNCPYPNPAPHQSAPCPNAQTVNEQPLNSIPTAKLSAAELEQLGYKEVPTKPYQP